MRPTVGDPVPPMRFRLTKRIPMAAGLAGGSSDAAAALRLLAARHPGITTPEDIRQLAARIGADVPFFLDGAGAALVTGVGEAVEPLPPPIDPLGILLLTPLEGSSTPAVFRAWDESARATAPGPGVASDAIDRLARLLRGGVDAATLAAHAPALRSANDLWPAATMVTPGLVAAPGQPGAAARSAHPAHRFRVDPVRALSFSRGRSAGRATSSAATPASPPSGSRPRARPGPTSRPSPAGGIHDQEPHRDHGCAQRRRTLQPGHRRRRHGLLLGPGRARPADRRAGRGRLEAQTERALRNLGAVLEAAGLGYGDVVKTTCFLVDIGDFAAFNAVYGRYFPDPPPARSTFAVAALPKGARVEVEAVAKRPTA